MNSPGDTLIGFRPARARYVLTQLKRVPELDTLLMLCKKKNDRLIVIHVNDSLNLRDMRQVNIKNEQFQSLQKKQIVALAGEVKIQMREVRKQKVGKIVGIVVSGAVCAFGGYKLGQILGSP